jgi:predicted dehydrogenase
MVQTLNAAIPTLVEKPIALLPDDADRMVAAPTTPM